MIYRRFFALFTLMMIQQLHSQLTLKISALPASTAQNERIFMASSLNNWNPADPTFELKKDEKGFYSITLPQLAGKVEYKFTRGSWDTVEGDENGNATGNRILIPEGSTQREFIRILSWQKAVVKNKTRQQNVKLLSDSFYIPQLQKSRRIWIYLPDDYTTSNKKYSVIYMHDAQNLFDDATSFSGEWGVDETLNKLAKDGIEDAIVVGIENGGESRLNEYSPWKNQKYGGGEGNKYVDFLAKTLKPYIDKHYRTKSQATHTGLIGSSMGGLITLYAGVKYPQKFGKLGVFSPSIWFAENDLLYFIRKNTRKLSNLRFYFVAGKNEYEDMVSDIEGMADYLKKEGVKPENLKIKIDDYGTHSESYWRGEFDKAYEWLFFNLP